MDVVYFISPAFGDERVANAQRETECACISKHRGSLLLKCYRLYNRSKCTVIASRGQFENSKLQRMNLLFSSLISQDSTDIPFEKNGRILRPSTNFRPIEKARGGIQLPHEILVSVLKVDCTVAVM